jgi:hypothetical protein
MLRIASVLLLAGATQALRLFVMVLLAPLVVQRLVPRRGLVFNGAREEIR